MKVSDFDYHLPPQRIAQQPSARRDESRLLVLHRDTGQLEHRLFKDLREYLSPGDVLVLNTTRVIPARLFGHLPTGGKVEVLLTKPLAGGEWECMCRPARKLRPGTRIIFAEDLSATVTAWGERGARNLALHCDGDLHTILARIGHLPLPPYIREQPQDESRYQTVYAQQEGSAAAPTAGLHFTPQLLQQLREDGVILCEVLLHVGMGTFLPVQAQDTADHVMHSEWYQITPEAAATINTARKNGGRIVCVGTTAVRTLESSSTPQGEVLPGSGETSIFISPGYTFKAVDALITNFHLPKSTLVMLVSAFASREQILGAYACAVEREYRFFSFGDAMLIL